MTRLEFGVDRCDTGAENRLAARGLEFFARREVRGGRPCRQHRSTLTL